MRSLKEISVGNGWYWLAGAVIAYGGLWLYMAVIDPLLPVLAWHRTHSRKMQFAEFSVDVPLLWYLPESIQGSNSIFINKAFFAKRFAGSIALSKSKSGSCIDCFDSERRGWARLYGASATISTTYRLASGSMDCLYHQISPYVVEMHCINEKTGSTFGYLGSKQSYLKLHDIVH